MMNLIAVGVLALAVGARVWAIVEFSRMSEDTQRMFAKSRVGSAYY